MTRAYKIYILSIIILNCSFCALGQKDTAIFIKEIGWGIDLPSDFTISHDDFISRTVNVKTLLSATNAQGDLFFVSYDSSQSLTSRDWKNSDNFFIVTILNAIGMKQFLAYKNSSGIYIIGGEKFKVFNMDCTNPDHSVLHLTFLSGFYKHHYILMSYFYRGHPYVIFAMLAKSKFNK